MPHRTAERAAVNDPTTWGLFSDARAAVEDGKADGAGIVLGNGLVGIDLDHCRDPETGAIEPWALEIVHAINSYTETSPSGRGLHILVHGSLPPGQRRKDRIEMYADGRYFTVTGNHVGGTPLTIEERVEQLALLHADTFTPETAAKPQPSDLDDTTLLNRARAARNGPKFCALWDGDASRYASQSEADLALCEMLAFWTADERASHRQRRLRSPGCR
jgi:primase-polymerase (primpol)-like protein